jgi:hypothetical protein
MTSRTTDPPAVDEALRKGVEAVTSPDTAMSPSKKDDLYARVDTVPPSSQTIPPFSCGARAGAGSRDQPAAAANASFQPVEGRGGSLHGRRSIEEDGPERRHTHERGVGAQTTLQGSTSRGPAGAKTFSIRVRTTTDRAAARRQHGSVGAQTPRPSRPDDGRDGGSRRWSLAGAARPGHEAQHARSRRGAMKQPRAVLRCRPRRADRRLENAQRLSDRKINPPRASTAAFREAGGGAQRSPPRS